MLALDDSFLTDAAAVAGFLECFLICRIAKRGEEKRLRKEKFAALEGQCKESLAVDRKSKRKSRLSSESEDQTSQPCRDGDAPGSETGSAATAISNGRRERAKGHTGYLPSDSYRPTSQPMRELNENEEEEEDARTLKERAPDGVVTPADLSSVPWHHAQLYRMYGRNADYYIHPKMQEERKKVVHPTLKRQKGHLGAGHIWTTLRSDSTNKLLRTDRRFPKELKEAFGAHVRDGITKHKKPVFRNFTETEDVRQVLVNINFTESEDVRHILVSINFTETEDIRHILVSINFTETEDVPDLPRLLDQSLLRRIRVLRHKTELMYRSSQTNHDRTKILLFNSPLPEPNEGDQGIGKYLPSWDEDNVSDTSEASYMKWLKKESSKRGSNQNLSGSLNEQDVKALGGSEEEEEAVRVEDEEICPEDVLEVLPARQRMWHPQSVLSPLDSEMNESLHEIWHKVMARQRPRKENRYHFLTEREAKTKGEFLAKLGLEPDKIDRGRTDLLPQLDYPNGGRSRPGQARQSLPTSVKAMSAPREERSLRYSVAGGSQMARSESAQHPTMSPSHLSEYETRWQPLSMHALIEYKEQLDAEGAGEFSQGRQPMWRLREATAAVE
ncbi:hypothetical protein PoB_002843000 [Plakobranchus ocellatus]|uniref:Uncharacterized protein n=1 Tax=Plakobranchus ocellatus TaxID=259542 RepID=A0AAV4A3J2_9GAST|nr:hypothetical protein PoB_002843000 [Plakobranchus ocellatus]